MYQIVTWEFKTLESHINESSFGKIGFCEGVIDFLVERNGSVKNRIDKQVGRSTLTYLMKDLREKDIPEAEANYYDQLQSEGSRWAANISFKAIKENGFFDENDEKDMLEIQYKKIQELQSKFILDYRLLLIENDALKEKGGDKRGS